MLHVNMRKTEDKVNDVRETVAGALVGAGVANTLTTTYPHKYIGSVRTEVMDAATSEQTRIAAAATDSDKDTNADGRCRLWALPRYPQRKHTC